MFRGDDGLDELTLSTTSSRVVGAWRRGHPAHLRPAARRAPRQPIEALRGADADVQRPGRARRVRRAARRGPRRRRAQRRDGARPGRAGPRSHRGCAGRHGRRGRRETGSSTTLRRGLRRGGAGRHGPRRGSAGPGRQRHSSTAGPLQRSAPTPPRSHTAPRSVSGRRLRLAAATRRIAATERSTSASVVDQFDTETRISRRPRQVVPPSQQVPSRCTPSMTRSVRASSPKPTSTWLRTTSLTTSAPPAASPSANRSSQAAAPVDEVGDALRDPARAGPPTRRNPVPAVRTRGRGRRGRASDRLDR